MSRSTLIILGSCLLFATVIVVTLYSASPKIVNEPNNFVRDYIELATTEPSAIDIEFDSYYIAGVTNDHIYLGNVTAPFRLLVANHTLTDTQHVRLTVKNMKKPLVYSNTIIKIDSPYFYMADGIMPALFRGKIGEWEAERFMFDSIYYNKLVPISTSSFAIRVNSSHSLENVLGKIQNKIPHIRLEPGLLEKQVDGTFCTDGELFYNTELKKLVYTYFYRNGYIVYDTNLNLEYRGHTIDTFTRAQIRVGYIKSNNSKKLVYKKFINKRSYTSGNHLFINSSLLAKNDPADIFSQMDVIDVYDLRNDNYKFSFTLVNPTSGAKLNNFVIIKNKVLIAICNHHLVKYDLKSQYF